MNLEKLENEFGAEIREVYERLESILERLSRGKRSKLKCLDSLMQACGDTHVPPPSSITEDGSWDSLSRSCRDISSSFNYRIRFFDCLDALEKLASTKHLSKRIVGKQGHDYLYNVLRFSFGESLEKHQAYLNSFAETLSTELASANLNQNNIPFFLIDDAFWGFRNIAPYCDIIPRLRGRRWVRNLEQRYKMTLYDGRIATEPSFSLEKISEERNAFTILAIIKENRRGTVAYSAAKLMNLQQGFSLFRKEILNFIIWAFKKQLVYADEPDSEGTNIRRLECPLRDCYNTCGTTCDDNKRVCLDSIIGRLVNSIQVI